MTIQRMICPPGLANNPGRDMQSVEYITIHTTGNRSATANAHAHAIYQARGSDGRAASWHYTVDATEVWQSFDDLAACWHTGSAKGNNQSIGIEICVNDRSNFRAACQNAAWLTALLLDRFGLPLERVVQHFFFSGKNCPAELRSGEWGIGWKEFIELVDFHSAAFQIRESISADLAAAIATLEEADIIQSPDYWFDQIRKVKYLDFLLMKMARFVKAADKIQ